MNAIESITRSQEAESIYCQARRAVDEVDRRNYDGHMPEHLARQLAQVPHKLKTRRRIVVNQHVSRRM